MSALEGRCLCGAVRFEVGLPVKWTANCHCSMCRRAQGAPYVTWVGVHAEKFRIVAGEDVVVRYRSSEWASRRFCSRCGSPLTFEGDRWPGEVHVTRALLPDAAPLVPQAHAYWDSRAPWVELHDDLNKLPDPK